MVTEPIVHFPTAITILAYVATAVLVLILLLVLLRLSGQINALSVRLTKSTRSARLAEPEDKPNLAEAEPGSPFDEFLTEDPQRRSLSKGTVQGLPQMARGKRPELGGTWHL